MHGKCPKCEQIISHVNCDDVEVRVAFGTTWKGVSYNCPHCQTVLSVQIDPIAVKTDIINRLFEKLRH